MAGRLKKIKNPEELAQRCREYIDRCEALEKPKTISGLCLWLRITRETLRNYKNKGGQYKEVIEMARLACENDIEENALLGKYNANSANFNLKNNFGWTDKIETINTNANINTDLSKLSTKDIRELLREESKGADR